MNKAAIAKQLDDWQVLPKPKLQRLSELYFASAASLPASVKPGVGQRLSFTVHNVEHRTTQYHYRVLAVSGDGSVARPLRNGALTLSHDRSQDVTLMISLPPIGSQVAIKVELEYEAVKPEGTLGTQKQSIHHWVHMTGSRP